MDAAETRTDDLTARYRHEVRESIGPRYSGALHVELLSLGALACIAAALSCVRAPTLRELFTVPVTFLYANLTEYLGHRYVMHVRRAGLSLVHERHTLIHHRFFTAAQMSISSARDIKVVLFPPVVLLFFFGLFALPVGLLLARFASANVAALFVATAVGYYLCYEWLHLAYHLDPRSALGSLPALRALRRHHQLHHDPAAMSEANFNITFPICDALFRTAARRGAH
jgi:hypothetical protein